MFGIAFTILVVITAILQMWNFWSSASGNMKLHYQLTIIIGILYSIIEGMIAFNDPAQRAALLFVGLNAWIVMMGVKGLRRLKTLQSYEKSVE